MRELIKLFFVLAFIEGVAFAENNGLTPLYQACEQGVRAYQKVLEVYEQRTAVQIENEGVKKLRKHFERQDSVYDFLVLHAPHLIPDEVEFGSFYMDCWADLENFKTLVQASSTKKKRKPAARKAFSKWESCQKDAFRAELPKTFLRASTCFKKWLN